MNSSAFEQTCLDWQGKEVSVQVNVVDVSQRSVDFLREGKNDSDRGSHGGQVIQ